jgi:superfamily II DNA or RNA helicase
MERRRAGKERDQPSLFSIDPSVYLRDSLGARPWPAPERFPVNHAGAWTRQLVLPDLVGSAAATVIAGFSSLAELIELAHAWAQHGHHGHLRIVLGSEPFPTERTSFGSRTSAVTDEARTYWLEQGISLLHSAKLIEMIKLIEAGRVQPRAVPGPTRLHAKLYIGEEAATVGSSNFTGAGLIRQLEANARFDRRTDGSRYHELVQIAANYWSVAEPCADQLIELLRTLLQVVTWQEALARACAELLEGEWASRYVAGDHAYDQLWPSQQVGIAQALWIAENVGSILVADATGPGKTRMGAHLVRALHDRLWRTGRVRQGISAVVSPPAVLETWVREAIACGVSLTPISHGGLSRDDTPDRERTEQRAVVAAQILAVDEAHNFLNDVSKRTRRIHDNSADHVVLFTATPINKDARDLLQLVSLLGADNFTDETLAILDRLDRRRAASALSEADRSQLRREIQRFTVRRTKSQLNSLVDQGPDAYVHRETGRVCRYPEHDARRYRTGETAHDERTATRIRELLSDVVGLAFLGRTLEVPASLFDLTEERWLEWRLGSARGLASHRVLAALGSSRAAAIEHVRGTAAAREAFALPAYKAVDTGDMIATLSALAEQGPPANHLSCDVPTWLTDPVTWAAQCELERDRYERILSEALSISDARERTKAELLADLAERHDRVLAFDHHPATLAVLERELHKLGITAIVATGGAKSQRLRVERLFRANSTTRAVALCSDAMNEGLNLQGASAIVQLDLPTTLRVVEQRVGRVDRMNSPYARIEVWWPEDGPAFVTRASERLAERAEQSAELLGANLVVPGARPTDDAVDLEATIAEAQRVAASDWDGISDALDPVRQLVDAEEALIPRRTYEEYRARRERVLARVAPLRTDDSWAFFSVAGVGHGAPRWMFLDGDVASVIVDLDRVAAAVRQRLAADPPNRPLDDDAVESLERYLTIAAEHETQLLPRRLQRALQQMHQVAAHWADGSSDLQEEAGWRAIAQLVPGPVGDGEEAGRPDPYVVAQRWLELVRPAIEEHRRNPRRRRRYRVLGDITPHLKSAPLPLAIVQEAMTGLELAPPLHQRVTACILGVP